MENTEQENKTQGTPVDVIVKKELENIKPPSAEGTIKVKTEASSPVTTPGPVTEIKPEPAESVTESIKPDVEPEPTAKIESSPKTVISGAEEKAEVSEQQPAPEEAPMVKQAPMDTQEEDLPPLATQPGSSDVSGTSEAQNDVSETEATSAVVDSNPTAMGVAASQMGKSTHPHRNNKKLAVIMTIVVALTLSAIAVYVYMSTNENTETDKPTSSATQQLPVVENELEEQDSVIQEDIDQNTQDLEGPIIEPEDGTDPTETETLPETETLTP